MAPARRVTADVVLMLDQSVADAVFVAGAFVLALRRDCHVLCLLMMMPFICGNLL